MDLKGNVIDREEAISIPDDKFKEIVINWLLEIFGLPERSYYLSVYLEEGKIVKEWEEGGGSHSWFEKKTVRKATSKDKALFKVIEEIYKK